MRWFSRRQPQIGDSLWQVLLTEHTFISATPGIDLPALRAMTNEFLAAKQFAGAQGLQISDEIGAAIAVQACLPVFRLGLKWYDDFEQIIVYPDQFRVQTELHDDIGLVHEQDDFLAGQSISGGPIVLSWADVQADRLEPGYNVVVHEFVHKLDLRDGQADGCPPMPARARQRWLAHLDEAFEQFEQQCERAIAAIPDEIDPESAAALPYLAGLPLDPYAATDPAEFFAVAGETLFTHPNNLAKAFPNFDRELRAFFGLPPIT